MTKRQKNTISQMIGVSLAFIIVMFYPELKSVFPFLENIYIFIVFVLLTAYIFSKITQMIIPTKKNVKKNNSKAEVTTKTSNKRPTSQKPIVSTSRKKLTDSELLTADIDSLQGADFERLCYLYFKDKGFNPEETPPTGDHGVDLVITDPKDGLKIAVQCKRYTDKKIGNRDLRDLEAGKKYYKCYGTLFITTNYFTDKAREYAESLGMDTWNGLQVNEKIGKWRKQKLNKTS